MRLGTRFVMPRRVVALTRLTTGPKGYCLELEDGERVQAKAVVVATTELDMVDQNSMVDHDSEIVVVVLQSLIGTL